MIRAMRKEALSLDLDGPVIWKIIPIQSTAIREYGKYGPAIYSAPASIPPTPKYNDNRLLKPGEIFILFAHSIRFVYPDARRSLQELQEVEVFGNTGRPDQKAWRWITKGTLQRGKVLGRFANVFHKPSGLHTMESKLANVALLRQHYGRVTHVDDNPADALPIAAKFKDVEVRLVRDFSTDFLLSKIYLENDYPNVKVVSTLREALESLY